MVEEVKKLHDENGDYTYDEKTKTKTYERADGSKRVMKDFQREDAVYDANNHLRYHKAFLQYVSLNGNGKSGADNDITYYSEDGKTSLYKGYNNPVLQYTTEIDDAKIHISASQGWGNSSSYKYESGKNTIYAEGSTVTTAFFNDTHLEYEGGKLKTGMVINDWNAKPSSGVNPKVTFDEKGKPEKVVSGDGNVVYKDGKISEVTVNSEPRYTVSYDKEGKVSGITYPKKNYDKDVKIDSKKGKEAIEAATKVAEKANKSCKRLQEEANDVENTFKVTKAVAKSEIAKLNAEIEAHPELYPIQLTEKDREMTKKQFRLAQQTAEAKLRTGLVSHHPEDDKLAKRLEERNADKTKETKVQTQTYVASRDSDGR